MSELSLDKISYWICAFYSLLNKLVHGLSLGDNSRDFAIFLLNRILSISLCHHFANNFVDLCVSIQEYSFFEYKFSDSLILAPVRVLDKV